jgi:hypothetical protein
LKLEAVEAVGSERAAVKEDMSGVKEDISGEPYAKKHKDMVMEDVVTGPEFLHPEPDAAVESEA